MGLFCSNSPFDLVVYVNVIETQIRLPSSYARARVHLLPLSECTAFTVYWECFSNHLINLNSIKNALIDQVWATFEVSSKFFYDNNKELLTVLWFNADVSHYIKCKRPILPPLIKDAGSISQTIPFVHCLQSSAVQFGRCKIPILTSFRTFLLATAWPIRRCQSLIWSGWSVSVSSLGEDLFPNSSLNTSIFLFYVNFLKRTLIHFSFPNEHFHKAYPWFFQLYCH